MGVVCIAYIRKNVNNVEQCEMLYVHVDKDRPTTHLSGVRCLGFILNVSVWVAKENMENKHKEYSSSSSFSVVWIMLLTCLIWNGCLFNSYSSDWESIVFL